MSFESLLAELETTISDARKAKQHGAVIQALTLAARLAGLLRERIEVGEQPSEFRALETYQEVWELLACRMIEDSKVTEALAQLDEIRAAVIRRAPELAQPIV